MSVAVAKPIPVNPENAWRTETPAPEGWARSPRPDAKNKYYIASMDSHIAPPIELTAKLKPELKALLPRYEKDEHGTLWQINDARKLRFAMEDARLDGEDHPTTCGQDQFR